MGPLWAFARLRASMPSFARVGSTHMTPGSTPSLRLSNFMVAEVVL